MHALLMRARAHKPPGVVRMSTAPGIWFGDDATSVGNLKVPNANLKNKTLGDTGDSGQRGL